MESKKKKIPIIYSDRYNISVLGLENFHPFDTKKYRKIFRMLKKQLNLDSEQFYCPNRITGEELLQAHSKEYLDSLRKSLTVANIAEIPIVKFIPNLILQKGILDPMRYATGGTVMGLKLAIEYGWAINLSGGYHHANKDHGEGFCVYADIPIALKSIWQLYPQLKALIIDLDAHQGNGCSNILGKDDRVAILDIYNPFIFPKDRYAENLVSHKVLLYNRTEDKIYLEKLSFWLPKVIIKHKPDIIIYNAGTDIFIDDPIGGLNVTEQGILKRDEIVFRTAKNNKIPILMLLSGGYHKKSGDIVGRSIVSLINKGILN